MFGRLRLCHVTTAARRTGTRRQVDQRGHCHTACGPISLSGSACGFCRRTAQAHPRFWHPHHPGSPKIATSLDQNLQKACCTNMSKFIPASVIPLAIAGHARSSAHAHAIVAIANMARLSGEPRRVARRQAMDFLEAGAGIEPTYTALQAAA